MSNKIKEAYEPSNIKKELSLDKLYKLININLTVNDNYDNFDVVLHRLLHAIEIITNSETTSLLVYDSNKKDLIFRYATGATAHDIIGLRVPHGSGIAHTVANTRKGMIVNDIAAFNYYQKIDSDLDYKTRNLMAYPVLDNKGEVFGVVEACNKKDDLEYNEDDYQLLSIFCQQAEKTIRHALHIHTLKQNISDLTQIIYEMRTPPIIYESKEMKNNVSLMQKIAKSNSPILLTGEPGTGKSLFARHIHASNYRNSKPLLEISCLEVAKKCESLEELRVKFWGIDKNYKIGIKKDVLGFFESTRNGTIILDNVEALPFELQKEITQFLIHKFYYRVHSEKARHIDVRVVCTSTANIPELINKGTFYEELYFLINSLSIRLNPLNRRNEDLQAIIKYYFDYYIKKYHKDIEEIEAPVISILKRYHWKHNMHSLLNVIEDLVINCEDKIISNVYVAKCMYSKMEGEQPENVLIVGNEQDDANETILPLKDAINKFKAQYIHKMLLLKNWNHTKTAKELDIQRSYLSRLVKEFDLNKKSPSPQS